ncbi:TldD/PmbA family protein [Croceicoccus sp. YJ47]|uniref:TldD/PmbA family protein n=1 Tax=Croceicoccus sp. YJ47 TaxID=2798724 RepID=UPI0019214FFA|nr:metallopeptidase TldD-related protein [Croceicoccus sp. YJ47]QQN75683.1 TldD/PmbA family protein [Croceicoccus sp. YJ47]
MLNAEQAESRCHDLIARVRRLGADAADAVYLGDLSETVHVRLGALEEVERSESEHFGLRVFIGQKSATIGSSAADEAALDELSRRAVAMAEAAPADPYAGLAPADMLMTGATPALDLLSPPPGPDALREAAERTEAAGRAHSGITNSDGAAASYGRAIAALVTSHGFAGNYEQARHARSISLVAGKGAGMERGYAGRSARHAGDLPDEEKIGTLAADRALERLHPGTMSSGPMPVVFDPRVGGTLLGHLAAAISGHSIARQASFLLECEGKRIFPAAITVADDPLRHRGLRSRPFDGEGLPTAPRDLVAEGRLTGWLLDSASARKLGRRPTGHAARSGGGSPAVATSNVTLNAGDVSRDALIADIRGGVLVTELIGQGVNLVTGDYSRGASGFRIVNGAIAGPVAGFTIAGNLLDMFAQMTAADDLDDIRAVNVPSLRVDGMTVAGG